LHEKPGAWDIPVRFLAVSKTHAATIFVC
jgi:hypothetical protein